MKKQKKFSGIIVPAVTPLTGSLEIDPEGVENLFSLFYTHSISPFILGTTGESASLPARVKEDYVRLAEKNKKEGTQLYAGISSNVLKESVEFAFFCADHSVDALAATLPSYYALSTAQMKRYFSTLADVSPLPVIIYNIPATTHMSIPLELIDELSHHPNIVATKDSERSDERLEQSLSMWKDREDFGHFLGWAARSAVALKGGSDGLIPSTGNLVQWIYADMLNAAESGDWDKAAAMQVLSDQYGAVYQANRTLGESLWSLKVLMESEGICGETVMPPLQSMGANAKEELIAAYKNLKG